MNLSFEHPLALALLLLAALPWLWPARDAVNYSSLSALPRDTLSSVLSRLLRLAASLAFASLALGLAGINAPAESVERIGKGAEIVLLLDRSRSMDQPFYLNTPGQYFPMAAGPVGEVKGKVARRLLAEFAASRTTDRFAMVVFSSFPIKVLDFTQKPDVIQAAIRAGDVGRGLSETDIGRGLLAALSSFDDRPYTGSRVILLVSDGGAHLEPEVQRLIIEAVKRHRVSLYWIYIRSRNSPGLLPGKDLASDVAETVPEHFLHEFFQRMGVPYRAYEAEDPEAMNRAIADVNRLESFPIRYRETLPRRDLSQGCYMLALILAALLAAAAAIEVPRWSPS
jgi:mxaC protein